jgi:hypothetical protein
MKKIPKANPENKRVLYQYGAEFLFDGYLMGSLNRIALILIMWPLLFDAHLTKR